MNSSKWRSGTAPHETTTHSPAVSTHYGETRRQNSIEPQSAILAPGDAVRRRLPEPNMSRRSLAAPTHRWWSGPITVALFRMFG